MAQMPEMTARNVMSYLTLAAWKEASQEGSHRQFVHPVLPGKVTVADHTGSIPLPILKSIFVLQAGMGDIYKMLQTGAHPKKIEKRLKNYRAPMGAVA